MLFDQTKKNVALLALCQALNNTGNSIIVTVSALAGYALAIEKSLATLPLALQFTATTLSSVPASLLMARIGRRNGFIVGALIGLVGGVVCTIGLFLQSFFLFSTGSFIIGILNGFALYYRFAAADTASESFRGKAISLVLAGGLISAFVGPELARNTREFFGSYIYAGTYLTIALLPVLSILLLLFIKIPPLTLEKSYKAARPLTQIISQPMFIIAVLGSIVGYGVMVLLMTATPLAMKSCSLDFNNTAFVIQWHIVGMFLPSFFTGRLIQRFGVLRIMMTGAFLNLAAITTNLSGNGLDHFWVGLFLLGLGWNFLFIGSTTLLTYTYSEAERAKTQAANEFVVFSAVAVASLSSGALQYLFGWETVNMSVIPLIVTIILGILWLRIKIGGVHPAEVAE